MSRLALLLILALAACTPSARDGPGTEVQRHTGVTVHRSEVLTVARDEVSRFRLRAAAFEANGTRRFALLTSVLRADRNKPDIRAAYSLGTQLTYRRGDRRWSGCQYGPNCPREEVGHIPLSEASFRRAATEGLSLELIGPRGSHAGHAPARLFDDVLKRLR